MITISKVGPNLASLAGYTLEDALNIAAKLGFESVEIATFDNFAHSQGCIPGFWFDELTEKQRRRLKKLVSPFSYVSTHAPFVDCPLFTYNKGIKREAERQVKVAIEATAFLGGSLMLSMPILKLVNSCLNIGMKCLRLSVNSAITRQPKESV